MGECYRQCASNHPAGANLYDTLAQCVYCDACPNACSSRGSMICERPSGGSSCEQDADCDACARCAKNLTCADALAACADDRDCVDYASCIAICT